MQSELPTPRATRARQQPPKNKTRKKVDLSNTNLFEDADEHSQGSSSINNFDDSEDSEFLPIAAKPKAILTKAPNEGEKSQKLSNDFEQDKQQQQHSAEKELLHQQQVQQSSMNLSPNVQIINKIKVSRKKLKNSSSAVQNESEIENQSNLCGKRGFDSSSITSYENKNTKRMKVSTGLGPTNANFPLAKFMVDQFETFSKDIQQQILKCINEKLNSTPELCNKALKTQVQTLAREAINFYENQNQVALNQLLSSVAPMAAILLNIEIILVNEKLSEQGAVLNETLLPYIEKCTDFSFLRPKANFILNRCLNSLVLHIKDTKASVAVGFILFAFKFNPTLLPEIMSFGENLASLQEALVKVEYGKDCAILMAKHPRKFLWPELMQFLEIEVVKDPGSQMGALIEVFNQRQLLLTLLLKVEKIELTLPKLVFVLEKLIKLPESTISKCFAKTSKQWEMLAEQLVNKDEILEEQLPLEKVEEIYKQHTMNTKGALPLQKMIELSQEMCHNIESYSHCTYQASIAAALISQDKDFVIAAIPTGAGKTWIQGLIAKHFCMNNASVTIIEPNELLRLQTAEKLTMIDFKISVCTIDYFYQYGSKDEVCIIDEYDSIIDKLPYMITNQGIAGLWQFKSRKVFAFSATTSIAFERFVNNCINAPAVLKFASEYELKHGTSPIQEGYITQVGTNQNIVKVMMEEVHKNYDRKPIVIVHNDEQLQELTQFLQQHRYKFVKSASEENLQTIRAWDYGILLIAPADARGIDTRFAKDALVLIASKVDNYHQYLQMLGRSSRSRGICEGIYFSQSQDPPALVIEKLKRSNLAAMQDLEIVVNLLAKKCKDNLLIVSLKQAQQQHALPRSLKSLEELLPAATFAKVMKGIQH